MILVTGGAGFIGSNFILDWMAGSDEPVVGLDQLTYAGKLDNLAGVEGDPRHRFVHGDINDSAPNNHGRFQFPEKLISLMLTNALAGKSLPVYGDGEQVRDWLHVSDHCAAIRRVLQAGQPRQVYNIGGNSEMSNLNLVQLLCDILDRLQPAARSRREQIAFVADRPGHDRRYAIDAGNMRRELGWQPAHAFEAGLEHTVRWYLAHPDWVAHIERRQA